ncbi:MAG: type II toxin-antitoxin system CcdA family antitoxin [Nanoarchaeota archaeon]
MTDTTISVRIDKQLHEKMKLLEHINWSALIRKALQEQVKQQQKEDMQKKEKMRRASGNIDKIRSSGVFNGGKTSVQIIREWRNKRR